MEKKRMSKTKTIYFEDEEKALKYYTEKGFNFGEILDKFRDGEFKITKGKR